LPTPPIRIPVLLPRLPTADKIAPHLAAIDRSRRYSNFGPLVTEFESRLAAHFGSAPGTVLCVANATVGLTTVLLANEVKPGGLCLMPAWTFAATPSAAMAAGLVPYFADVDLASWALDPAIARKALAKAPAKVAAVMPVSPFGAPLDLDGWIAFQHDTGVPVVIDAAAQFDGLQVTKLPSVVSLHATKTMGIGEGGLVASTDANVIRRTKTLSNFGFYGSRSATGVGFNAKLSEYGAAVGLAALAEWPQTRAKFARVAQDYVNAFAAVPNVTLAPNFGARRVTATCSALLPVSAARVEGAMAAAGIETRRWWGTACHRMIAFHDCPRTDVPVTEQMAERVIGLPFFSELATAQVEEVVAVLAKAIAAAPRL
jgi:dTDP-4-amino-4,6-dideoxygalactose transaminase